MRPIPDHPEREDDETAKAAPPLVGHGPVVVDPDTGRLVHADGAPLFWLGDTWWMALCGRLSDADFDALLADRVAKGFTVIQLVAGLFPEMSAFDPRGALDGHWPWEPGFARLDPRFFELADRRVEAIVRAGLVPCIVGAWGYHLRELGVPRMKEHWRALVERWGGHPVIWFLAGETLMPWYLTAREDRGRHVEEARAGWREVARHVRSIDVHRRPLTSHPCGCSSALAELGDDVALDLDMVQGSQGPYPEALRSAAHLQRVLRRRQGAPVVMAEVCYEGIRGAGPDVQRFAFWSTMLSGAAGFTYGANGVWQVNQPGAPFGPSPHGRSWGDVPWQQGMNAPGSAQVALGARLLRRFPWWRFEPRPDWVEPCATPEAPDLPYAAGVPGECRVIYVPGPRPQWPSAWRTWAWRRWARRLRVLGLEPGIAYRARRVDPATGVDEPIGTAIAGPRGEGAWPVPLLPAAQDWLVILERPSSDTARGEVAGPPRARHTQIGGVEPQINTDEHR